MEVTWSQPLLSSRPESLSHLCFILKSAEFHAQKLYFQLASRTLNPNNLLCLLTVGNKLQCLGWLMNSLL